MRELGIALVACSPLGRGSLTGAVSHDGLEAANIRTRHRRSAAEAMCANRRLVQLLERIGQRHTATPAQVAIAWVAAQSRRRNAPLFRSQPRNVDDVWSGTSPRCM
jgi:aryl-alcohol dehydrogenase-like predicted oxidoreductase